MKIGFDNEKYLKMQSEHIRERINQFDNKLYLEFGGKLFDDYHASRVLPGFEPDSKLRLLKQLSDQAEIVIVISAKDIEKNKVRGDLGITYDSDVLRLMDSYRDNGLYVGSVVITQYSGQESASLFRHRLENMGIRVYQHYCINGYPSNIPLIVSDEGYGKNDYIETSRPLVIITAPGPGSGKMATCLSQLYHEHKRGIHAGYAKFETFPIWNLPLKHPVNLAYEAATADLNDVNMIDPFHLEAYDTDISAAENTLVYQMPLGNYTDFQVEPSCGLAGMNGVIDTFDDPRSFYSTDRQQAQLIWFSRGYIEYRFPNKINPLWNIREMNFPWNSVRKHLDIMPSGRRILLFLVNGTEIGTYTCPGDLGARRGRLTPNVWPIGLTQYGFMTGVSLRKDGCYINEIRVTDENILETVRLSGKPYISLRIGVRPDAVNQGGINLFGEKYGDFPQGINMRIVY